MAMSPGEMEAGAGQTEQPVENPQQEPPLDSSSVPKIERTPFHLSRARLALEHHFTKDTDRDNENGNSYSYKYFAPPEARSDLQIFQNLVGIYFLRDGGGMLLPGHQKDLGHRKPVPPLTDIFLPATAANGKFRNRGLYARCLSQDQRNRVMYGLSNYLISMLYLLQILIAAAITGLSAYEQKGNVALTILGAINTVLAGILAWLNGQGMPTRFRRARDQYKEVVKAIETAERTFAEIDYVRWKGDSRPNPYAERDRLERLYEEARSDQESNYPDTQEGPSKNQMEGTKRVLEEQIRGHIDEKNNHAQKLADVENAHDQKLQDKTKTMDAEMKAERRRLQSDSDEVLKAAEERFRTVLSKLSETASGLDKEKHEKAVLLEKFRTLENFSSEQRLMMEHEMETLRSRNTERDMADGEQPLSQSTKEDQAE